MTYIVYIPDVARGEAAYTQRSFGSLKDLARWAMDAALDGPTQAPAPEIIKHEMVTPVAKPVDVRPINKILTSLAEEKKVIVSDASANTPVAVAAEPEWNEDTSGWFTEESRLSKTLEARDWPHFASEVINTLLENAFTLSLDPSDLLRPEDVRLFLNTVIKYLPTLGEELAPVLADVRWNVLPAKFQKQLKIEANDKIMRMGMYPSRKAKHPVAKAFCEMISFFRDGKRHISWKSMPVTFRELEMFKTSPLDFAEALMTEWWNGERTTDDIREFMIKLTALRFFVNSSNKSTTVGSAEFLDQFFKHVMNLAMPKDFIAWAIKGTTHRHCKKALQELEIQQARRAEGQRYVGLEEIKDPLDEESSKYSYEFNYELYEPFGSMMSDSLTSLDGMPMSVGEPDQICLLAPLEWTPAIGPLSKMFSLKVMADGY
jgi:hypothetical protein